MKRLMILLPLCFAFLGANAQAPVSNMDDFDGCGMDGSATTARLKALNQLKNRYAVPQDNQIDSSITLSAMLAPGDDKTRWSSASGAGVCRHSHHALEQLREGFLRRLAQPRMHGRDLQHGAARRHEPVEAFALRQPADGAAVQTARGDAPHRQQMLLDERQIRARQQR